VPATAKQKIWIPAPVSTGVTFLRGNDTRQTLVLQGSIKLAKIGRLKYNFGGCMNPAPSNIPGSCGEWENK